MDASRQWDSLGYSTASRLRVRWEFSSYTIPVEQSDRVLGAGHEDNVHQGPGTVRYR